mmetsp:Transcript_13781/g.25989  ORF Transcript_13781/g.25989 Transcript_13781/m.25989 type:complete len:267 (-) Transcript_13781:37-837(-)
MGNKGAQPSNRDLFNSLHERNRPEAAISRQNFITGNTVNLPKPAASTEVSVETIQMEASVERTSIKCKKLRQGSYSLGFLFSSTIECSITIFLFAEEVQDPAKVTLAYKVDTARFPHPATIKCSRGLMQPILDFELDLAPYTEAQLTFKEKQLIPVVVEIRPIYKDSRPVPFEATLLKFYRVSGDTWGIKTMKQKLTVGGRTLELFDMKAPEASSNDCYVCMSEVHNPLILPCKHLSLCSGCLTSLLELHDNACPVCREPVESLKD